VAAAKLSSRRPYLLRAMREWMLDNALTPQIIVDATVQDVVVPRGRCAMDASCSTSPNRGDGLALGNDALNSGRASAVWYSTFTCR